VHRGLIQQSLSLPTSATGGYGAAAKPCREYGEHRPTDAYRHGRSTKEHSDARDDLSVKAQRRFGLSFSWPRITTALLADVALLALASSWPHNWQVYNILWWVGVGIATVVAILAVLTYEGISLPGAVAEWVLAWSVDSEAKLTVGCLPPVDHQRRFSRDVVGLREHRGRLVSVIALEGQADSPGRHHHRDTESSPLHVEVVALALRQFDVRLDSIDIVSVRLRRREPAAGAGGSNSETGELRRTWLILRMDPQHNVAAVATRDSLASTVAAATERLAEALDGRNCAARPLTADEFANVDRAVLADLQPTWKRPGWRQLRYSTGYATSFWVSPRDINSEMLTGLFKRDTDAAVLTLRVTHRQGGAEISAWVRYHSAERLSRNVFAGLNRLTGRQLAALRASLPAPATRSPLVVPARRLDEDETLLLPVDAAAQPATQQ
jgi:type VII secretion protein EccE